MSEPRTTRDAWLELEAALLELRATVLATLTTPRAVLSIAVLGVAVALFAWFCTELARALA